MIYKNYLLLGPQGILEASMSTGADYTPVVARDGLAMVWARLAGNMGVIVPPQITVLGSRYDEVFADPTKRAQYLSVVAPDAQGNPVPFAVFEGCGTEMGA